METVKNAWAWFGALDHNQQTFLIIVAVVTVVVVFGILV